MVELKSRIFPDGFCELSGRRNPATLEQGRLTAVEPGDAAEVILLRRPGPAVPEEFAGLAFGCDMPGRFERGLGEHPEQAIREELPHMDLVDLVWHGNERLEQCPGDGIGLPACPVVPDLVPECVGVVAPRPDEPFCAHPVAVGEAFRLDRGRERLLA